MRQFRIRRAWIGVAAFIVAVGLWTVGAPASRADPSMIGAWVIPQHGQDAVNPRTLVAGLNGNEWVVGDTNASNDAEMQQVTPSGAFSVLPTRFDSGLQSPSAMVTDGGDVWALDSGRLEEINATGAVTNSFSTTQAAGSGTATADLAVGADGDLYVAAPGANGNEAGSIDQFTRAGAERVFPLARMPDYDFPDPLALAVVGNTIFYAADDVGDIESITTAGVPGGPYSGVTASPNVGSMVAGPDGDLWVISASGENDGAGDDVEQISPAGVLMHDYAIGQGQLDAITVGSDGRLWFTEPDSESVGAIDPSTGTETNYSLQLDSVGERQFPMAIAPGADSTIWYTAFNQSSQLTIGEISLTGAPPAPALVPVEGISPSPLVAFGNTGAGYPSRPQVVTISNTGQANLTTGTPTFTGDDLNEFSVTSSTCTGTVAPGASCQISLTFTPRVLGARSASLQIATNDAANGPLTVSLTGTGFFVPTPAPPISDGGGVNRGGGGVAAQIRGTLSFSGSPTTATVGHSGTVSLPLACSTAGRCTGTATLTTTITTKVPHHAVRVQRATRVLRRTLILGTRHYSLTAGAHSHIVIHLSAKGLKLLKAAKGHRLKVTAVIVNGTHTVTHSLSVRAAKPTSRTRHRG